MSSTKVANSSLNSADSFHSSRHPNHGTTNDRDNSTLESLLHALLAIDRTLSTRARPGIARTTSRRHSSKDRIHSRKTSNAQGQSEGSVCSGTSRGTRSRPGHTTTAWDLNHQINSIGNKQLPRATPKPRSASGSLREAIVGLYAETPEGQLGLSAFQRSPNQQTGATPAMTALMPPIGAPIGHFAKANGAQRRGRGQIGVATKGAGSLTAPSNSRSRESQRLLAHYARYRRTRTRNEYELPSKVGTHSFRQPYESNLPAESRFLTRQKEVNRKELRLPALKDGFSRASHSTISTNTSTVQKAHSNIKDSDRKKQVIADESYPAPPTSSNRKSSRDKDATHVQQHQPRASISRASSTLSFSQERFRDASSAQSSRTARSTRSVRSTNSAYSARTTSSSRVSIDLDSMRRGAAVQQAAADRVVKENLQIASRLVKVGAKRGPYNRENQLEDYVRQLSAVLAPSAMNRLRRDFAAAIEASNLV